MIKENLLNISSELPPDVKLVAVSKFHPVSELMEAYDAGQRLFGENRPQELAAKVTEMPSDVQWHFIGHLQTNKLKLVLPHITMLQSVDSVRLLDAVNSWCVSNGRVLDVLLEFHLGAEDTKGGLTESEIVDTILPHACSYEGIRFCGLMGMATHTDDADVIRADFARIAALHRRIRSTFTSLTSFTELSIGMSSDYRLAIPAGATIIRLGTVIFGPRA